ncbi:Fic family protein [Solihabitans fulvus]|uniref:Fic family protein n=1 Tax=Solihabitans fulvus TaxID=1892852 RepID=A0A5B2XKH7_9PSEU|nr:Fic family protein [Solihabitans fulvus]KAA2263806.1 Fic family protein [Solihabitans fulvus]
MPLFEPPALDGDDLAVLELIQDQRNRLRPLVAAPRRWSGMLRRVALARAVRGSNTIEGFTVSVDDAFAVLDDQEPMEADELAWHAVRGYRDAMTYVLQLAHEDSLDLCVHTVKALHFMMQQYDLTKWPGRWRPDQVFVYDSDNRVTVYLGPEADEVPDLVHELVDDINSSQADIPALVRAALAHLNLVMIHPFKDGNGRMARCLQTLLLTCDGTLAPEFSSIEEYLGYNEQDYYRVLAEVGGGRWAPDRGTELWVRFCLTAHYRQALRVERRAELASRLWIRAEDEMTRAALPERCVQPFTFCLTGRVLRNATYRQLTQGLSQNAAGRDLNDLVKAGLLEPRGEKRWRHYVPTAAMRSVADDIGAEVGQLFTPDGDPYRRIAG